MTLEKPLLLVDGKRVPAASGSVYDNINPATEMVLGPAADAGVEDALAAIAAARRAFDTTEWARNTRLRQRCLTQLQDALREEIEHLRDVTVAEAGCPVTLTTMVQVDPPIADMTFTIDLAGSYEYQRSLPDRETWGMAVHRYLIREPIGVVAAITPWNFPLMLNLAKIVPALAAGCTVVLKAAPDTPWTAAMIGRLVADKTEFPPGVINVLTSENRSEVGEALIAHADVDMITFTGSTPTGKRIMERASGTLKRVFLELGGKSPAVVLPDADLATAVGWTATQVLTHSGQGCALTTRLLVPRARMRDATDIAAATMGAIGHGPPTDPSVLSGPLINARQRDKVLDFIESGRTQATLAYGGGPPAYDKGFYVAPTLFTDVPPTARIAREEIFGPVLTITPYDTEEEALAIANDSIYGLAGAVFSADPVRARHFAARMATGNVSINGAMWLAADAPFGGYKQSGLGREYGVEGFEEYLALKSIAEPA